MGGRDALWRFAHSARRAGVTTATDLANELPEETVAEQIAVTAHEDYPFASSPPSTPPPVPPPRAWSG